MSYEVSRISERSGATIRYLFWNVTGANERYPTDFDNSYRFIRFMSIFASKVVVAQRNMRISLDRENFTPNIRMYSRFFDDAEDTVGPANLQGGEIVSSATEYYTPSDSIIGKGIIMPQRSQILAIVNSPANFAVFLEMIIIEANSPEALAIYI